MAQVPHHEFAPPPTPGLLRALLLALVAHALLLVALTSSIAWNQDIAPTPVQAELWSAVPVAAGAPADEITPPPPPQPTPEEKAAEPAPPPPPPPVTTPQPSAAEDAAIAIARRKEKEREALQKAQELAQAQAEQRKQEKLQQEKLDKLAKEKKALEQAAKEKLAKEQAEKDKLEKAQAQAKAEKEKQAKEQAALEQKKQAEKDKAAKSQSRQQELAAAKEAKMLDDLRQQNMKRIAGMAGPGGNGDPGSTSKEMEASGPSAGYAGRIVARIKPNIVFTEDVRGNPRVEVEIRTSVSGNILSSRITQSSGVKSWDDAVLRAIEKTEVLPKDINGTIPTSMTLGFRPKE